MKKWKGRHSEGVHSDKPFDRLSRIGDDMMDAGKTHREGKSDDKMIVMLEDDNHRAFCAHGYKSASELVIATLANIDSVIEAEGGRMHVIPMMPPMNSNN